MGLPPKVPHHGTASRARQGPAAVPAMQGLCRVVPLPWQAGCLDGAATDRWAGPLRNGPASAGWVGPPSIAGWGLPSTAGPGLSETARPALPGWGLPLDRWAGPLRNGPASAAWVGPPLGHPACPRARPRPLGLASPKRPGLRCLGGGSPRRPFALAASLPCGGLRPPAAGPLDKPCCVGPIFGKEAPL